MIGNGKLNLSHVAFLQLGHFPLQLLVVCTAGSHPGGDNAMRQYNYLTYFDAAKNSSMNQTFSLMLHLRRRVIYGQINLNFNTAISFRK